MQKTILVFLVVALFTFETNFAQNREIQTRIISGIPAALGQLPWQVILKKDEMDDLHCGGSVIAPNWVLTAAHCTYGFSSMFLMFGTTLLYNSNAVNMTSTSIFIHPNYNHANFNNDVSLISLPTPLQFSKNIQPIPLVSCSLKSSNFLGATAIIAGFGVTDDEYLDFSKNLLYARVTIIDNSQCESVFGSEFVISSTMCARGYDGSNQSICSGDSGGPLISRDSNGHYMQIGINSFVALDMCAVGYPSGYVRLASFLEYVSQTTGMALC